MGKVILEFDSVEEQEDIKSALDGYKWKLVAWDLDQHLRSIVKYQSGDPTEDQMDLVEKLREELRDIINGYGLNLND
jgi:hypothetical protein